VKHGHEGGICTRVKDDWQITAILMCIYKQLKVRLLYRNIVYLCNEKRRICSQNEQ